MSKYEENKGFCMFYDWVEDLSYLEPADAWQIVRALNAYYTEGTDPVALVEGHLKAVAALLMHQIRRQEEISAQRAELAKSTNEKCRVKKEQTQCERNAYAELTQSDATNTNTNTNTDTNTNTISITPPEALSEGEKEELIRRGVPEEYLERQSPRACVYVTEQKPLSEILWEWWQKDRRTPKPRAAPVLPAFEHKSYDLEEFWQAALARTEAHLSA